MNVLEGAAFLYQFVAAFYLLFLVGAVLMVVGVASIVRHRRAEVRAEADPEPVFVPEPINELAQDCLKVADVIGVSR